MCLQYISINKPSPFRILLVENVSFEFKPEEHIKNILNPFRSLVKIASGPEADFLEFICYNNRKFAYTDPDCASGSGFRDSIESGTNPDPQYWLQQ